MNLSIYVCLSLYIYIHVCVEVEGVESRSMVLAPNAHPPVAHGGRGGVQLMHELAVVSRPDSEPDVVERIAFLLHDTTRGTRFLH